MDAVWSSKCEAPGVQTRFSPVLTASRTKACLPLHLPALGQKLVPGGYPSPENEPIRREPLPINPRYFFTSFVQLRFGLITFLLGIGSALPLPLARDNISGIRVDPLILTKRRSCARFKFPDPRDAPGDSHWGFDLVLDFPCVFIDECCSEGRISRESERATAHLDVLVNSPKSEEWQDMWVGDEYVGVACTACEPGTWTTSELHCTPDVTGVISYNISSHRAENVSRVSWPWVRWKWAPRSRLCRGDARAGSE